MDPETKPASDENANLGKRKRSPGNGPITDLSEATSPANYHGNTSKAQIQDPKRPRLPSLGLEASDSGPSQYASSRFHSTLNGLPVEILQHVCSFLDPFELGRLLCVSQVFAALIDPERSLPRASGLCKHLALQPQDSLWAASRMTFMTDAPKPMSGLSEVGMMRLLNGEKCQYCGRLPINRVPGAALSQWDAGPGPLGVRAIWPFKVRSCADCLRPRLIKEQDLILSPHSALQPGLPFACFTPSLHYISTVSLRLYRKPTQLRLTKYYFRPQLEDLDKQATQLRVVAPAALVAWYRGIEQILQDSMTDVAQFEQWELTWQAANSAEYLGPDASSVSSYSGRSGLQASSIATSTLTSTTRSSRLSWSTFRKSQASRPEISSSPSATLPSSIQNVSLYGQGGQGPSTLSYQHGSAASRNPQPPPARSERSLHEATRAKAERRADIEQRCQQLVPPLLPSELHGMKAFSAAIQIAKPLDEKSWSTLKSRLLTERQELALHDNHNNNDDPLAFPRAETVAGSDVSGGRGRPVDVASESRRSTPEKVKEIADDFIKRCYRSGTNLTSDTVPIFAVEVLDHVAVQFYAIQEQEDAALALQGQQPPGISSSGMRTRQLHLRHIKHVVDECVIPYTDYIRKDLFQCSGCDPTDKFFPFNGLIQHYAAKHTSHFSRGQHTVRWSSEWPHQSPPYRRLNETVNLPACTSAHEPEAVTTTGPRPVSPSLRPTHSSDDRGESALEGSPTISYTHGAGLVSSTIQPIELSDSTNQPGHRHPSQDVVGLPLTRTVRETPHSQLSDHGHGHRGSIEQKNQTLSVGKELDLSREETPVQSDPRSIPRGFRFADLNAGYTRVGPAQAERDHVGGQIFRENYTHDQRHAIIQLEDTRDGMTTARLRRPGDNDIHNLPSNAAEDFLNNFDPYEDSLTPVNRHPSTPAPLHMPSAARNLVPVSRGEWTDGRQHRSSERPAYRGFGNVDQIQERRGPLEEMDVDPSVHLTRFQSGYIARQAVPYVDSRPQLDRTRSTAAGAENPMRRLPEQHFDHTSYDEGRRWSTDRGHSMSEYHRYPRQHDDPYAPPADVMHRQHDHFDNSEIERLPIHEQEVWDSRTQSYYVLQRRYVPIEGGTDTQALYRQPNIQYNDDDTRYRTPQAGSHHHYHRTRRNRSR